jgi:drug/metabolite transporter (DMT)-like permease
MDQHRRALIQTHLCVFLWGFTAILGKLISLPATQLVWWRMLLVTLALALLPRVWRGLAVMSRRSLAIYAGIGTIVAIHWLTFYGSIKLANASVAATCMAVAPVVAALIEPWVMSARFQFRNLTLALLVIPGVVLVVGGIPDAMRAGFWVGAFSGALTGVFGVLNKRFADRDDPLAVTGVELTTGFVLVALLAPLLVSGGPVVVIPGARDAWLLLILAIACTLVPFALSLVALRHVSAFTAVLAINLEPVYAIAIAAAFLGEARELGGAFYLGVVIVMAAVFGHAWLSARDQVKPSTPLP